MQHGGGDGAHEVDNEGQEVEVRARHTEYRRKIKGRVQARVQYVEAVCMWAGWARSHGPSEARRRDRARGTRARLRGRGDKSADDAEGRRLADCQWKIRGDAHAGRWYKSESEGAWLPGITSSVQWNKSTECGHRGSVGGRETTSSPIGSRIEDQ
jgi:hypothetical protein